MTYRSGLSLALLGILFVGLDGGGSARAQAPQGGGGAATPLPLALDLKKVPVGSWSEYRIADGQNTMQVRMALVAQVGKSAQIETEIKGGPVAALGRTTMRMSVPTDGAGEVKPTEQVIQLGENPPMFIPAEMTGGRSQTFKKLDPKKRVGVDSITVAAGPFPKAEHYQDKGANGETIDFWISKTVMPFGLIKVASAGPPGGKPVQMELTAQGSGAKPAITKTPQPFDATAIMKQAQPAMGGGAGHAPGAGAGPMARPMPVAPAAGAPTPPPASSASPAQTKK